MRRPSTLLNAEVVAEVEGVTLVLVAGVEVAWELEVDVGWLVAEELIAAKHPRTVQ